MKKMAFFDLDGTLCQGNSLILGEGLVEAFDQLRKNEVHPVIASGRSLYEVKELFHQLKIETFILAGGCYAHYAGETILNETFSNSEIESILRLADRHELPAGYFNQQGYAVTKLSEIVREHIGHMAITGVTVAPDFYHTRPVNYMNLYMDEKVEARIDRNLEQLVDRMRFSPLALTISPKNVSKGNAIQKVMDRFAESEVDTYAFGDNNNDVSMFKVVNHGIAMCDATEQLKYQADYVAKTEHGVLEGLKHFELI